MTFILYADKNKLTVRKRGLVTSGSVNVYPVCFAFSSDWDGLTHTAVFRADGEPVSVLLDDSNQCGIPWEVLVRPGVQLHVGVYGTKGEDIVLPTIWAGLGQILPGAAPGKDAQPPTPDLWEQELAGRGNKLDYTPDGDLGLYADETLLSAVPVVGGGGEGGTSDHRALSHRDAEQQHPIGAIAGLSEELNRIPEPVEALTNEDLEDLLK